MILILWPFADVAFNCDAMYYPELHLTFNRETQEEEAKRARLVGDSFSDLKSA